MDALEQSRIVEIFRAAENEQIEPLSAVLEQGMDTLATQFMETRLKIFEVPPMFQHKMHSVLYDIWYSGQRIAHELYEGTKADYPDVEQYFIDYGRTQYMEILRTTVRQFNESLLRNQRQGRPVLGAVEQFINSIPQIAANRAQVIAQTELHSASQYVSNKIASRDRKVLTKTWVSIIDEHTRTHEKGDFDHLVMNGTEVSKDQPFNVPRRDGSSEQLLFPGDPHGSAGNIINCRCIQLYGA